MAAAMIPEAELIRSGSGQVLAVGGHIYYKHSESKGIVKWVCYKKGECYGWVKTQSSNRRVIVVRGGPAVSEHKHPNNPELVKAKKAVAGTRRDGREHPERPAVQLMRRRLHELPPAVLSQMPSRENLRKMITRDRLRDLPSNPMRLEDLESIPAQFRSTFAGENFLLYDSYEDENYDGGRVIVFATQENIRTLFKSSTWFLDGTFDTAPTIFTQVFAILGNVKQRVRGVEEDVGIPFVYALLDGKTEVAYTKVIEVVVEEGVRLGIRTRPPYVMSDFELAIINACKIILYTSIVKACFFHLRQSVLRKVQAEGLKAMYEDEEDRSVKEACSMMTALAYVPTEDVEEYFDVLYDAVAEDADEKLMGVFDYFETYYVRGKKARGRRKAVKVRYAIDLWNVYDSILNNVAITNNVSEGWHNRFRIVVGKSHPSLYAFLKELQKEQADTETMLSQISLGQPIRKSKTRDQRKREERLSNIVAKYEEYKEDEKILDYLKLVSYHV